MIALAHRLPAPIARVLFGDRERHGLVANPADPDWQAWERLMPTLYQDTNDRGINGFVNALGYRVMRRLDLTGKRVLEIGPGNVPHLPYWLGTPAEYLLVDRREEMLADAAARLRWRGVPSKGMLSAGAGEIPVDTASVDVVISFYTLEHLHPIGPHLDEIARVLKRSGALIGAIPAEGGLAWGLGRALTTRRWFRANTAIDYDKIICWEHPNFAPTVIEALEARFVRQRLRSLPFGGPLADVNLVSSFLYRMP